MPRMRYFVFIAFIVTALTGCSGWYTNWIDSSPKDLAKKIDHDFDGNVIIIGAGAAGLAAANLLKRNNVEFLILEATDHYGGRIQKNENFADFPIDIGAEWIHQKKDILTRLIDEDRQLEKPVELIRYNPSDIYSWDGKTYEKVSRIISCFAQWSYPEYKFKSTTWYDYIDWNFAQNVSDKIIFNSPVIKIDHTDDKVIVTTGSGQHYSADKVITTVSIGVLRSQQLSFEPALSAEKVEVFSAVEFLPGFKLFMKFSEKFYPDVISVDSDIGEYTYYDVAYNKDVQDNVFGLLSTGSSAIKFYELDSDETIVAAVLSELDTIFDGRASESYSGEYLLKDWGQAQFTLGTWSSDFENVDREEILYQPLQQKVYFAGETFDKYGQSSTVHGAIISGYTAVHELLRGHSN